MTSGDDLEMLTTRDVLARFRVSRMTLSRWVATGQLTPVRLSCRSNRYLMRDLEKFAARHQRRRSRGSVIFAKDGIACNRDGRALTTP